MLFMSATDLFDIMSKCKKGSFEMNMIIFIVN